MSTLLWISFATSSGTAGNIYYVKPSINGSRCPNHQYQCHTLMYYISNPTHFFTSKTQLLFLPGEHVLRSNATVQISNIVNFSMAGTGDTLHFHGYSEPASKILCQGQTGFRFHNVTSLQLQKLTFTQCEQASVGSELHGALVLSSITSLTISDIMVRNSRGYGLHARKLQGYSFITDSTFLLNKGTSEYHGGNAYFVYENCTSNEKAWLNIESSQFLNGYNHPKLGSFASGIVFKVTCANVSIHLSNVTTRRNVARDGGNLAVTFPNTVDSFVLLINNTWIEAGSSFNGGGMSVNTLEKAEHRKTSVTDTPIVNQNQSISLQIENTMFTANIANAVGAGVYLGIHQSLQVYPRVGEVSFKNCTFHNNTITWSPRWVGVAVHIRNFVVPEFILHSTPQFHTNFVDCTFSSNSVIQHSSANDVSECSVFITNNNPSTCIGNSIFLNNSCTAVTAINSNLIFWGSTTIKGNSGYNGGGMALYQSLVNLGPHTIIMLANNHAAHMGGGMYVDDRTLTHTRQPCFFQLDPTIAESPWLIETVQIRMENNVAEYAGSDLFGGSVDNCYLVQKVFAINSSFIFSKVFCFVPTHDLSYISSTPHGVCLCSESNMPNCDSTSLNKEVFPGEMFEVSAVVTGQRNGTVPGNVFTKFSKHTMGHPSLGLLQGAQKIHSMQCSLLHFEVFSNNSNETLILTAQQATPVKYSSPQLNIVLKSCPLGFALSDSPPYHCKCAPLLVRHHINCYINNQTIQRPAGSWIGSLEQRNISVSGSIWFKDSCPFDYCKPYAINVSENNQDEQCNFNRTGILCGACPEGLSVVLGSSKCHPCSNLYLLLLIPFALGGLLLVIFLIVCNLTVSEGTINGLVFYANLVKLHQTIIFQGKYIPVLTDTLMVFIAWLNLDLGIKTCFYDGMDTYVNTWLQFAFLSYVWSIIGLIILFSRKYIWVTRLVGRNAVKVVATLLLISYSKLQLTAINVIQYVRLYSLDGEIKYVWIYDGNVRYLSGKHIPLFIIAVVLAVLSMAYAFVLVFIQCLQKRSNMRILFWVEKLKPVFDAYTGPCRDNQRFWPGLLLVIRTFLFIINAINAQIITLEIYKVMLTSGVSIFILIVACVSPKGIYKKWSLNILEFSFFFNLCLLSLGVATVRSHELQKAIQAFIYISVGISFLTFIGIILYHTHKQVASSQKWRMFLTWLAKKKSSQRVLEPVNQCEEDVSDPGDEQESCQQLPPVLRFDQLREPLLT